MIYVECTVAAEAVEDKYDRIIKTLSELYQAALCKQGKTEEATNYSNRMIAVYAKEKKDKEDFKNKCDYEFEVTLHHIISP